MSGVADGKERRHRRFLVNFAGGATLGGSAMLELRAHKPVLQGQCLN